MERALEGVRVIEIASYIAGPHAGMMLGDLGAEVIKIEPLDGGYSRVAMGGSINGETVYHLTYNRNKKSVVVDLQRPEGRAIVLDLVKIADVVLDNFRPGVMAKLGLDFESLKRINPRIISCSISGFGATGPYAQRPAYDYLLQGLAGVAHEIGDEGGEPRTTRFTMVDIVGGDHAVLGILAALQARHRTGRGQMVDIALLDGAWEMHGYHVASYLASGHLPPRPPHSAHPLVFPSQIFQTSDSHLILSAPTDAFFVKLCRALELSELADDPRFARVTSRLENKTELVAKLSARFRERTTADWIATLSAGDVPAAPVNDLPSALADPQVQLRGAVVTCEHPVCGEVKMVGNPIKLSDNPEVFHPAPLFAQHTEDVLSGLLGYSADRIAQLVEAGVCKLKGAKRE